MKRSPAPIKRKAAPSSCPSARPVEAKEVSPVEVPPPLMVTGTAAAWVEGSTVHCTRIEAPPPFPELLHWVTVALVVLPTGLHDTVGWVPPPAPDPLHWLTVAGEVVELGRMALTTCTLQITLLPPP